MSNFATPSSGPDNRSFASYPVPPKIDYFTGGPRQEVLMDARSNQKFGHPPPPGIQITTDTITTTTKTQQNFEPVYQRQQFNQSAENSNTITKITTTTSSTNNATNRTNNNDVASTYKSNLNANNSNNNVNSLPRKSSPNASALAAELAKKEANLMVEIQTIQQRPYSPYQVPPKIDLTTEHRAFQTQQQNTPSPRPFSRASSNIEAELLDKEAKLMQEIEELERKPYNPQRIIVERDYWYEYPEGRPDDRQLVETRRRVVDFCSMPEMVPQKDVHIHEENLPSSAIGGSRSPNLASIHTAIIRRPRGEIDNKSPLPFSFDNFSTKGVRGNIASVGAVEPDRPRPPIYPVYKRSPTPNMARG